MPITFDEAARSGLIDTARGIIRNRFGDNPPSRDSPAIRDVIREIQSRAANRNDISFETARSIVRRALASIQSAQKISNKGNRLPIRQHSIDPSFAAFPSSQFVYRTIVLCKDPKTQETSRTPVDVENETPLSRDEIEEEAIKALKAGQNILPAGAYSYASQDECIEPEVLIVFAIRTR